MQQGRIRLRGSAETWLGAAYNAPGLRQVGLTARIIAEALQQSTEMTGEARLFFATATAIDAHFT